MINSFLSFTSIDVKILNSNSIVSHCVERKDFRFNIADKININFYFIGQLIYLCDEKSKKKMKIRILFLYSIYSSLYVL